MSYRLEILNEGKGYQVTSQLYQKMAKIGIKGGASLLLNISATNKAISNLITYLNSS